jgi:hypothetical protein
VLTRRRLPEPSLPHRPQRRPGRTGTPIRWKGRLVQYAGRILRSYPGKATAEVHDYHDPATGVLAASLAGRAPGYTSLGFPDPRRIAPTPSATSVHVARPPELVGPDMTDRL